MWAGVEPGDLCMGISKLPDKAVAKLLMKASWTQGQGKVERSEGHKAPDLKSKEGEEMETSMSPPQRDCPGTQGP